MKYIHLLCLQVLPGEPVITVSEFDDAGFENRRVDIWRSGQIGWAGHNGSSGNIESGTHQFFSMDQFDDEPVVAVEITREDFENHWALAMRDQK